MSTTWCLHLLPAGVRFHERKNLREDQRIPSQPFAPYVGGQSGHLVGPRGLSGLVIPVQAQSRVPLCESIRHDTDLADRLVEAGFPVTDGAPVPAEEHLAHEHPIDPHLVWKVTGVPEAAIRIARIVVERAADSFGRPAIPRITGFLEDGHDGRAGHHVVQALPLECRHLTVLCHLRIHVLPDVVEILRISRERVKLFEADEDIPVDIAPLLVRNGARIGMPFHDRVSKGNGKVFHDVTALRTDLLDGLQPSSINVVA